MFLHPRPAVRRTLTISAGAALALGLLAAPATAQAATPSDHGGAARYMEDRTALLRDSLIAGPAKNVILLIGDGMGDSEITVARNYARGAGGAFPGIDALPLTGQYTTYALAKDGSPAYTPDSAATGTAWATGTKSYNGAVGVDIAGTPQANLLELAQANGYKTGNVSTAEIQDATPAVLLAHISQRGCYGPEKTSERCADEALENGGLGSISEQMLDTRPDVTLGGGAASFAERAKAGPWQGQTLDEQAAARGYQRVTTAAELAAVTEANQSRPLLGLFTPGNLPVRWTGPAATVGGGDLAPASCADNPARLESGLSLASLTEKAIDLLDTGEKKGFFLQVEGASIDKENHAANACGQIGETVDLDEAVQSALAFAEKDGNTLVVVTADHAHTSQIVASTPPGLSTHLRTTEGANMIVSYGTSPEGASQQHTGAQLRIAGYGPGAANVVGLSDQTDLFFTASRALGLSSDLAALSADARLTLSAPEAAPGQELTAAVTGLAGDRRVTAHLDGLELPGPVDLIDGAAVIPVTAPMTAGSAEVLLAGVQSGVTVRATLTVGTGSGPSPEPTDGALVPGTDADAGADGAPGAGGILGATGGTVPWAAGAAALLLLVTGAAIVLSRRRRLLPA